MTNTPTVQPTNEPTKAERVVAQWMQEADEVLNFQVPELVLEKRESIGDLADLLRQVRELRKVLTDAEHMVEDSLCDLMRDQPGWWAETPKAMVKMHSGMKRTKWDHRAVDDVLRHLLLAELPQSVADIEDGVVYEMSRLLEGVWATLRACETPSWKVTGLRKLQIDPDQFCVKETGRQTIELG